MVAAGPVAPAVAQSSTPSPEELWDAYPLAPGETGAQPDPAPTPTATATATAEPSASPSPTSTPAPAARDGGVSTTLVVGGALAMFAVGIGAGEVWRRRARAAAGDIAAREDGEAPPARQPEPARPAPAPAPQPELARPEPAPAQRPTPAQRTDPKPEPRPTPAADARHAEPTRHAEPAAERSNRDWLDPEPPPVVPARRFARAAAPPQDIEHVWTCEIGWKPGYRTSTFRANVAPPGSDERTSFGESAPIRWMLMGDPDPPTRELAEHVQSLSDALVAAGWEHTGRGPTWYSLRFAWRHEEEPRPIEPLTRKAAHV